MSVSRKFRSFLSILQLDLTKKLTAPRQGSILRRIDFVQNKNLDREKGSPMKSPRLPLTQLVFALFLLISFAPRAVDAQSTELLRATILISETIETIGAQIGRASCRERV